MGSFYCEDCDISELIPNDSEPVPGIRSYAVDPDKAIALWQFSEQGEVALNFVT